MNGTRARVLLVLILVLGAALRFTGLGWGLRHLPDLDERWFVEDVARMLSARDLDHRFYEYPGLFFYLLAPVLAFLHPPDFGPSAYLAARAVVALFGVASVGLTYVLGARLADRGAGLAAHGAQTQVSHHYFIREQGPESYLDMAWTYGLGLLKSFGPIGLLLVAAGAVLAAREWRRWLGLLLYPVVVIGVLSTAEIHF